jgi:hypothetical protein
MYKIRGNYKCCTCRSNENILSSTRFEVIISSCTRRSNENILSSSGGAQEKGKRGSKLDETQFCVSEFHPLLKVNILFCRCFFLSHPVLDQTQGSGAVFS